MPYLLRTAAISSSVAKSSPSAASMPAWTPATHFSCHASERPCDRRLDDRSPSASSAPQAGRSGGSIAICQGHASCAHSATSPESLPGISRASLPRGGFPLPTPAPVHPTLENGKRFPSCALALYHPGSAPPRGALPHRNSTRSSPPRHPLTIGFPPTLVTASPPPPSDSPDRPRPAARHHPPPRRITPRRRNPARVTKQATAQTPSSALSSDRPAQGTSSAPASAAGTPAAARPRTTRPARRDPRRARPSPPPAPAAAPPARRRHLVPRPVPQRIRWQRQRAASPRAPKTARTSSHGARPPAGPIASSIPRCCQPPAARSSLTSWHTPCACSVHDLCIRTSPEPR